VHARHFVGDTQENIWCGFSVLVAKNAISVLWQFLLKNLICGEKMYFWARARK
jgi:hypothetical protein